MWDWGTVAVLAVFVTGDMHAEGYVTETLTVDVRRIGIDFPTSSENSATRAERNRHDKGAYRAQQVVFF